MWALGKFGFSSLVGKKFGWKFCWVWFRPQPVLCAVFLSHNKIVILY